MITKKIAKEFIENLKEYSTHRISIIMNDSVVLYCSDLEQIDRINDNARHLLENQLELLEINNEHCSCVLVPLKVNNKPIGCLEISGDLNTIKAIIKVIKVALEIRLQYEITLQEDSKVLSNHTKIINCLMNEERDDNKLAKLLKTGNIDDHIWRVLILLIPKNYEALDLFENINMYYDSNQDIMAVYGEAIVILKSIKKMNIDETRTYIHSYLSHIKENTPFDGVNYISSCFLNLNNTSMCYKKCLWLSKYLKKINPISNLVFYDDYLADYMIANIPIEILEDQFKSFIDVADFDITEFATISDSLIKNNFNMNRTSEDLFMHKNTLLYKLGKLRDQFELDPIKNANHRIYFYFLSYYIKRRGLEHETN